MATLETTSFMPDQRPQVWSAEKTTTRCMAALAMTRWTVRAGLI
jgi:hypothetical protein